MSWIQKVLGIEAQNKLIEAMTSQMAALSNLVIKAADQKETVKKEKEPTGKACDTCDEVQRLKKQLSDATAQIEAYRNYRSTSSNPEIAVLKADNERLHQELGKAWAAANAMADPDTAAATFARIVAQEAESRGSGQRFHLELDSDVSRGIEIVKAAGLLSRPLSRLTNDLLRGWLHGQYRDMAARIAAQGVDQTSDQDTRI